MTDRQCLVSFTSFISDLHPYFGKSYHRDKQGVVYSDHNFRNTNHDYVWLTSIDFEDFADFIRYQKGLVRSLPYEPCQAILAGVPKESSRCVTKHTFERLHDELIGSVITRTEEHINHSNNKGNGLIILDIDQPQSGDILAPECLHQLLSTIIPDFQSIKCLSVSSSSACIPEMNKHGYRLYIPTNTPALIPQFMNILSQHLWLKGHGWHEVAANKLKQKCTIDLSMQSAHQFDFIAPPVVRTASGIVIQEPVFAWHGVEFKPLDCTTLPNLTASQQREYKDLVEVSKRSGSKALQTYTNTHQHDGVCIEYDNKGQLHADFVLYPAHMPPVSVQGLLSDLKGYEGIELFDPSRGQDDRCIRSQFYNNIKRRGEPVIRSFVSEGTLYGLQRPNRAAPKAAADMLDPIEAKFELDAKVNAFFTSTTTPPKKTVIAATTGLGKTSSVFATLSKLKSTTQPRFVHFYVPNHNVANDIKIQVNAKYPNLKILIRKGRVADNCHYTEQIDRYMKSKMTSHSVKAAFCDSGNGKLCAHYDGCEYLKQFTIPNGDIDVLILAHNYLTSPLGRHERAPDFVVIDEMFYKVFIKYSEFQLGDLKDFISDEALAWLNESVFADVKGISISKLCNSLNIFEAVFTDDVRALKTLDKEWLQMQADIITPDDNDNAQIKKLASISSKPYLFAHKLVELIEQIQINDQAYKAYYSAREKGLFKIAPESIAPPILTLSGLTVINQSYRKGGGTTYDVLCFHEPVHKSNSRLSRFISSTPILCIDGYADESISKALLGQDIDFVTIDAKRNMVVTQCNSRKFTKNELTTQGQSDDLLVSMIRVLNRIADANQQVFKGKTLLITYKALSDNLDFTTQLSEHISLEHLNNIRGLDKYNNHHIIVLGRNQMQSRDVILEARSLFGAKISRNDVDDGVEYDDGIHHLFAPQTAEYRGGGSGEERYFYDEQFNAVLAQSREVETLQAIARVRDIWANTQRQVFIFGSLALDIDVDRTIEWSALKFDSKAVLAQRFRGEERIYVTSPKIMTRVDSSVSSWKAAIKQAKLEVLIEPMGLYESEQRAAALPAKLKSLLIKEQGNSNLMTLYYHGEDYTADTALAWLQKHSDGEVSVVKEKTGAYTPAISL